MSRPYYYVRFRWWRGADLAEVKRELSDRFQVEEITMPRDKKEFALLKDEREELKVRADTLIVRLAPARAVLYQGDLAPFTENDVKLRERILEIYPHSTPTPFPWGGFISEPSFEVENP